MLEFTLRVFIFMKWNIFISFEDIFIFWKFNIYISIISIFHLPLRFLQDSTHLHPNGVSSVIVIYGE